MIDARAHGASRGAVSRVVSALVFPGLIAACAGPRREPAGRGLPRDDPDAALSVVFIGHATVLIRLGQTLVLTDPNLGGSILGVPRITPASVTADRLSPVRLILLSHLHPDHLDRGTLRALPANAEVIFPPDGERYLGLVRQRRKEAAELWKPLRRAGLTVTAVPVRHIGGRFLVDALWNRACAGWR